MNSILQLFPPELQATPALISGFLTLLGLVLCAAGIKVAQPMATALVGAAVATFTACVLPPIAGINPWMAAVVGLAAGLFLAAVAFRIIQSLILALCLSLLASSAFCQWQLGSNPPPAQKPAALILAQNSVSEKVFVKLPPTFQSHIQTAYSHWQAIPLSLRQSMIVIAIGVAILAAVIAWTAPRQTTWIMSATLGAVMMLFGLSGLISAYMPRFAQRMPTHTLPLLVILVFVIAGGMLVQRFYFWPAKRQQKQPAQDSPGELAPA